MTQTVDIPAAPTRRMTEQEIMTAKEWFIRRFVHSIAPLNFCLRLHGITAMTRDQKKKQQYTRDRNAAYDFIFTPTEQGLVITPVTAAAEWAQGIIFITMSDRGGVDYNYRTLPEINLFSSIEITWS